MTAHSAVGIGDDLSARQSRIRKGAADDKSAGGIDQRAEVRIQVMLLRGQLHDALHSRAHVFQIRIGAVLRADEERINAFPVIIIGDLAFCVGQKQRAFQPSKPFQRIARQHIRNRQQLRRFIGSIAEHHALIARAVGVHAQRDVGALLRNQRGHMVLPGIWYADALQNALSQRFKIQLMCGGDFARDDDFVILDQAFHRHAARFIASQAVRNDRVRNLIADLVGMPGGDLFAGEKPLERFLHSAPFRASRAQQKREPDCSAPCDFC